MNFFIFLFFRVILTIIKNDLFCYDRPISAHGRAQKLFESLQMQKDVNVIPEQRKT